MSDGRWSEAIERMLVRVNDTATRVGKEFPHWADPATGEWTTTPHGDWTGGFWIGMLWLAAAATGDHLQTFQTTTNAITPVTTIVPVTAMP